MNSPVKLFVYAPTTDQRALLDMHFGMPDQSSDAFLSFDGLVDREKLEDLRTLAASAMEFGFVDNRNVFRISSEPLMEFSKGTLTVRDAAPAHYRTEAAREFFLTMHRTYRSQLRRMCGLRRNTG